MPQSRAAGAMESYPVASCRERWLEFLGLEHETLAAAADYAWDDGKLLVRREPAPGRALAESRIPRPWRPPLLLQAAAAAAFFASRGFPLAAEDLDAARWDAPGGVPRLWLARTPAAVATPRETPVCDALANALARIFSPGGGRMSPAGARTLLAGLAARDAALRRGEHWVAEVLRTFPELSSPWAAPARERCYGLGGTALRDAASRALGEKARAILRGKAPRVFEPAPSPLTPGGALRLVPAPVGAADAVRRLRDLAAVRDGRPPVWIAVVPEAWDPVSRRAFEAARLRLGEAVEVVVVPERLPAPDSPAEWRRAIWAPCGSLAASVRFYEWFAEAAGRDPGRARGLLRRTLGSAAWAAFASDPTGDAPLPPTPEGGGREAPAKDRTCPADEGDPGRRIEILLEAGQAGPALREAERWVRRFPERPAEAWFALAARLSAAAPAPLPPWLETIEAEREIAGGRPRAAKLRLERVVSALESGGDERRRAGLRLAELAVMLGRPAEAARRAAEWRRLHPSAPAGEAVRALRLGATGLSREGRADCALALLDEAERLGAGLPVPEVVETALARARVFALCGRWEEETAVYESIRAAALGAGEDGVAARFLAQEARGLIDRREHARAIVRLEEAIDAAAPDPAERAALQLDLAATRYHAGDSAGSEAALVEALAAAASAGREDLARIARANRVELLVNRGAWSEAQSEIAWLESSARAEKDSTRRLVALHHRGRLALRRGSLDEAARDNAEARRLASEIGDRLEIGELWLEEGDRRSYEGDRDGARHAWEMAALAPPDRSERDRTARDRLSELDWVEVGGPPDDARRAVETLFDRDPYRAAESVARWHGLFGASAVPDALRERAARVLRDGGGSELAARVFGPVAEPVPHDALRQVRSAVLAALAGEAPNLDGALPRLSIAGLAVRDGSGRELVALGEAPAPPQARWRPVETGAGEYALALWPEPPPDTAAALTLLLETLLLRGGAPDAAPELSPAWKRLGIVTADASMEEPHRRLARFAPQDVTVLVLGESGSGKEAVARAIHGLSKRSAGPFVPVNVAAIPAGVLESELFGHARGAFSGADRERRGLLEEASGGTIFFDEIGDLALPLQAKLLRVLQERELRRVGENRARSIDVRVVSATSRDLAREVEAGRFREDLYYRLHVALIRLPALRERGRDALLLARHFLERYSREYGRGELRLAPESAAAIGAYAWPGNVRELQNAMAQAAALCEAGGLVTPALLPEAVRPVRVLARGGARTGDYRARVDAHRRDLIADALDKAGGNRSRAARELGLSRQALLYLIRELKVEAGKR